MQDKVNLKRKISLIFKICHIMYSGLKYVLKKFNSIIIEI